MNKFFQLVHRNQPYMLDQALKVYFSAGWKLYGSPMALADGVAQLVVFDVDPAIPFDGTYLTIVEDASTSLGMKCGPYLKAGWEPYASPYLFGKFPAQALIQGDVPIYGAEADGGQIPPDLLMRLSAVEASAGATEVTANQARTGVIDLSGQMPQKANLIGGKVPYEELPEFPVGRKVNVANQAARLALPTYADLTIAYQSDTGDAWGLDSNDDPAIAGNWSKLGNAQALGVASFNGRTGNIGPQQGDYTTAAVTEVTGKRYVTEQQIAKWDQSPNPGVVDEKIAAQKAADDLVYETKQHATDTFLAKTSRGAASGVAPLGSDKKIPVDHLPAFLPQSARVWRDVLDTRNYNFYTTNASGNEMEVWLRTSSNTATNRHILAYVRKDSSSPTFQFRTDAQDAPGARWLSLKLTVPIGWQYAVQLIGGTPLDKTGIGNWYELS